MSSSHPSPDLPAAERAAWRLRHELRRRYQVGDRLPPIKQLAQTLGIGQTNAHRAARQLQDEGLLSASTRRGTFVRRLPDGPGHDEVKRTRQVMILQTPVRLRSERFLDPAIEALVERLRAAGVDCHHHEMQIDGRDLDPRVVEQFDAMVWIQPSSTLLLANDARRPALVLTTSEEEPMAVTAGYDMISVDSVQGSMQAGQWMARIGVTEAAFVGVADREDPTELDAIGRKRLAGFERGFGQRVPQSRRLLVRDYLTKGGVRGLEQYLTLRPRPAGVFCASDDLAIGFVQAARQQGLTAGVDYHIIGFDGHLRGAQLPDGPLTTVQVPVVSLGQQAAQLLISRLRQPDLPVRRVLLGCGFIEGRTARPGPQSTSSTPLPGELA